MTSLGVPRVHFRRVDSTNARARGLAEAGAPHGTVVTADEQSAGRGRQGRTWSAPPGQALLFSVVLRDPPRLLPLAAGIAVAEEAGTEARIKWPNDVLLDVRKIAGILVEGRPRERWAVLGIGLNVAVKVDELPPELRDRAGSLERGQAEIEPTLNRLLTRIERWLVAPPRALLEAVRARDDLRGRAIRWQAGHGEAAGIDDDGRLVVLTKAGQVVLEAGEVHLG
ncbi:MAG TPA: biotin--[acetyl-CoA-carboxylase] ligase [Solirubrobacteraceae bacterium]|nr:biotin--[acetyl-CoA-carboxylase] ligase [Solirubrobacteraceae bacterium]